MLRIHNWLLPLAARAILATLLIALTRASVSPTVEAQGSAPLQGGTWETIANGNNIWALTKEGEHTLWSGTWGGGAVKWNITDPAYPTYRQYLYPQDGIPSNDVRSIAVDGAGNRWFATSKGLAQLKPDETWFTY